MLSVPTILLKPKTGEEGLEFFLRHYPDLILLDFNLPDTDGLEFIAELKVNSDRLPPISSTTTKIRDGY
ncbi:MAG: response regulator [Pleurocapsa sp. MO_192.B19]|nr:response regulator [Pleurocapsa sp. MO_192.B19]